MEVNEILKNRRLEKRISLHLAHQETRISQTYLEALESGDWNAFPAEVYLMGFMRKYSAYLGLNPNEIALLYQKKIESIESEKIKEVREQKDLKKKSDSQIMLRVAVLISLVIFLGLWWFYKLRDQNFEKEKLVSLVNVKNKFEHSSFIQTELLTLTAKPTEPVWLRIAADRKLLFEGFLSSGVARAWSARDEIRLRIGNVKAVSLALNGQAIDPRSGPERISDELVLTHRSLSDGSEPSQEIVSEPKVTADFPKLLEKNQTTSVDRATQ